MHKFKVGAGIAIMSIAGIPLLIGIIHGVQNELTYQECTHPSHSGPPTWYESLPCQNFASHLESISIYGGLFGIGLLLSIFGVK